MSMHRLLSRALPTAYRQSRDSHSSSDEESGLSEKVEELLEQTISFHGSHTQFFIRLSLALSVAFWVTLFSLPLYFGKLHYIVFGFRGELHETYSAYGRDPACESFMVGKMRNIGSFTEPQVVPWTPDMTPWQDNLRHRDIWCGYLPALWEDYWPNIAQFIVFTVFTSTGDTVRLAWQGLIGTACACMNLQMMCWFYPGGAHGAHCGGDADCVPTAYNPVVCWIDVLGVLFLFLVSRANENTIKFGMSWHVSFMMDFMNPTKKLPGGMLERLSGVNIWSNDLVPDILLTSVVGAAISILATIIPRIFFCMTPLANRVWVSRNALACAQQIGDVWKESIDYLCGDKSSAKKYQLQRKIDVVREKLTTTKSQVEQAWWETFQCGSPEQVRLKQHVFLSGVEGVQRTMYALANCILYEDFSGPHKEFVAKVHHSVRALHYQASLLTITCSQAAADGIIDEEEVEQIEDQEESVRKCQQDLLYKFHEAVPSAISASLAEEITFLFALAFWASTTEDLAGVLVQHKPAKSWINVIKQGFQDTWGHDRISETDHLKFVFRNFIPISVCYILAYALPSSSVFVQYSAIMPNTLALLITRFSGSAFTKNIHRTLGVLLGKFWPILLKASWMAWPCQSTQRGMLQLLCLFFFVAGSSYVYYSSKTWSTIAVLVAGYGVYPLMIPCESDVSEDSYYASLYREIGQVTVAIMLQFVIESALHATSPAELAIRKLEQAVDAIQSGFHGFFKGDLEMMKRGLEAEKFLSEARALAAEADPSVQLAPGWQVPFKLRLYNMSLDVMDQIKSDFVMLWTACIDQHSFRETGEPSTEVLHMLSKNENLRRLFNSLEGHTANIKTCLLKTLRHSSETALDDSEQLQDEVVAVSFDTVFPEPVRNKLYLSLTQDMRTIDKETPRNVVSDPQARAIVATRAVENAIRHLEDVCSLIIGEDIF
ncbi:unnamed protein product [Symbiodinium sp. CCMP2456]|nr:unnamed protein product [Symbiodinium sp. CCMP2456]